MLFFTEPWSKPRDKKGAGESPVTTPLAPEQRSAPKPCCTQKGAEMEMPCAHATSSSCPQHPKQHRATDRQHRSKPTKTITAGASPALLLEQKCARWELSFWRKPGFCRNVGASRQGDQEAPTRLPRRRLVQERSCSLEKGQPISTSRRTSSRKEAHAKVKDEKKITERGWSECSGHREEFQRLPEKEALVFLFGQKKKK